MNLGLFSLIFLVGTSLVGCDFYGNIAKKSGLQKSAASSTSEVKVSSGGEDLELARLILKREKKPIAIKKDPFEPLIKSKESRQSSDGKSGILESMDEDFLESVEFLGVCGMGGKVGALVRSSKEKGLYFVNDTFQGLIVVDIKENEVTLKKGEKAYKINRRENKI